MVWLSQNDHKSTFNIASKPCDDLHSRSGIQDKEDPLIIYYKDVSRYGCLPGDYHIYLDPMVLPI